jgi:hypothetical protein
MSVEDSPFPLTEADSSDLVFPDLEKGKGHKRKPSSGTFPNAPEDGLQDLDSLDNFNFSLETFASSRRATTSESTSFPTSAHQDEHATSPDQSSRPTPKFTRFSSLSQQPLEGLNLTVRSKS